MHYPICIEWGDESTAVGIEIPDIPGAATAGDTFEEAYNAAVEIAHFLLQRMQADGLDFPMPTPLGMHLENPEFVGRGWGMLTI
ncbi:putative RNase H-like HicB family nuclease [Pseudomonas frederiksbergensis]